MLIFQTKYVVCQISPFIVFHDGDGNMTEHFENAYMYDSKDKAEDDISTWEEDEKEKVRICPVEITCRL